MYNNEQDPGGGHQQPHQQQHQQQEMDLLSAVVNEAIVAGDHQLSAEDFAGLVDSMEVMVGGEEHHLLGDDFQHQQQQLQQPMAVGSTIEVETTAAVDSFEDHSHQHQQQLQQQQQFHHHFQQQQQQIPNLSLSSDVMMINQQQQPQQQQHHHQLPQQTNIVVSTTPTEQMIHFADGSSAGTIFGTTSTAQLQQHQQTIMMPPPQQPPPLQQQQQHHHQMVNIKPAPVKAINTTTPTLINPHPNMVTISPPQQQQQTVYRAIQPAPMAIAQKSIPTPSPPKVGAVQQQQQQTVFFSTASTVSAQGQPQQIIRGAPQTISVIGGNQRSISATSSSSMPILYVQQPGQQQQPNQQQTIITSSSATPLSPTSNTSVGGGNPSIIQIASRQKLIPVSGGDAGGGGSAGQRVIHLPANVRLAPAPVQIASAGQRPSGNAQQIKLAPVPSSTQQGGGGGQPRTILLKAVKQTHQQNMHYISFVPATTGTTASSVTASASPTVVHPIANQQTKARLIGTGTLNTLGQTIKPNMVHLMPAKQQSLASPGGSGGSSSSGQQQQQVTTGQKVIHLSGGVAGSSNISPNYIKVNQQELQLLGLGPATPPPKMGGQPMSIWMVPNQGAGGAGGGGGALGRVPIQLQATSKPYITSASQAGYSSNSYGNNSSGTSTTSTSKYVPIAPYPRAGGGSGSGQHFAQPMYLANAGGGGNSGKITVVKIPSSLQGSGHNSNATEMVNLALSLSASSQSSATSSSAGSSSLSNHSNHFLPLEESRRKPCNCTRSQCLKLYCECFANGEFCNNCNCVSCCNNLANEDTRKKAIRLALDRNPAAFHPKIAHSTVTNFGDGAGGSGNGAGGAFSSSSSTAGGDTAERKHIKGCSCKRSGCLKNYCECYEAKILCSDRCRCTNCKNFEESSERKSLMYLTESGEMVMRSASSSGGGGGGGGGHHHRGGANYGKGNAGAGGGGSGVGAHDHRMQELYGNSSKAVQLWGPDMKLKLPVKVKADCHPFNIFTDEILTATASCLMAQAEEGEFEKSSEEHIQGLILDQFGECLSQILNMASSNGVEDGDLSDDEKSTASGRSAVAAAGEGAKKTGKLATD